MQKTEQQAGLGMSFCEEEGRITVFRKTLEALEWPAHYRFLYNRKMKQIAVQACGAEEAGAHRVGKLDESNSGEIKCMALVRMIYGDSGWDKKMSYRLLGRAFPQQRLVSFKITDAWEQEQARLQQEYKSEYEQYKPIQDDLRRLQQVKRNADAAIHQQEQTQQKRREVER